jgi:hypothetical protein
LVLNNNINIELFNLCRGEINLGERLEFEMLNPRHWGCVVVSATVGVVVGLLGLNSCGRNSLPAAPTSVPPSQEQTVRPEKTATTIASAGNSINR